MEEICGEFTLWRLARVVFTEVKCEWEVPTLPVSLQYDITKKCQSQQITPKMKDTVVLHHCSVYRIVEEK